MQTKILPHLYKYIVTVKISVTDKISKYVRGTVVYFHLLRGPESGPRRLSEFESSLV